MKYYEILDEYCTHGNAGLVIRSNDDSLENGVVVSATINYEIGYTTSWNKNCFKEVPEHCIDMKWLIPVSHKCKKCISKECNNCPL